MDQNDYLKTCGLHTNPFSQEDAKEDSVFRMRSHAHRHAYWNKIFGDLRHPASAVVFGSRGSGKTALRMQMQDAIESWNTDPLNANSRVFLIQYDDLNPFLDAFRSRTKSTEPQLHLCDHMDAILSLGMRQLVGSLLDDSADSPAIHRHLKKHETRDLLMLTLAYDQSPCGEHFSRWDRLRKRVRYRAWLYRLKPWVVGIVGSALSCAVGWSLFPVLGPYAIYALLLSVLGWVPLFRRRFGSHATAKKIKAQIRVFERSVPEMQKMLLKLRAEDLIDHPVCLLEQSDSRYALLTRMQSILKAFGYLSIIVLVDRIDEPHAVNGSSDSMFMVIESLLDLKFLKHPQLGVKLLLPREVLRPVERASQAFHQRARLDKQNLVESLVWSGESLLDLANERISRCSNGQPATMRDLLETSVTESEIINWFGQLRIPRNMFKFMHLLLANHCLDHTSSIPIKQVQRDTWIRTKASFERECERTERALT